MSAPAQLCSGTKEEVLASFPGKMVGEDCPFCLELGGKVRIVYHRSQSIPASPLHPSIPSTPSTTSLSQLGHIQPVNVADQQVITSANALWTAIQQVPDAPSLYSDPAQLLELPFPFPGESMPIDRFDLHQHEQHSPHQPTFTYMGRQRFAEILQEVPVTRAIRAQHAATHPTSSPASAPSSAPVVELFPPVRADVAKRSITTFIYGTIGWGKSHLLAAMVCLLMRKGRKVVFLPDCKMLLEKPVEYFRSGLLLTFAPERMVQCEVATLSTIDNVISFCERHRDLTFIIDQYNALEQDMKKDDQETLAKKSLAQRLIREATFSQAVVRSASANNQTARILHTKQLHLNIVTLFGGLSQEEVSHWYHHFDCRLETGSPAPAAIAQPSNVAALSAASAVAGVTMLPVSSEVATAVDPSALMPASTAAFPPIGQSLASEMRERLEDITGCIPLYLRCFAGCRPSIFASVWQSRFACDPTVQSVFNHLLQFYKDIKSEHVAAEHVLRKEHAEILRCFLWGLNPHTHSYDHRYLYVDKTWSGHTACGLARECLAAILRVIEWDGEFVDSSFLSHIRSTRNPSMRGFLLEQACLTFIRLHGLPLTSHTSGTLRPQRVIYFDAGKEYEALDSSADATCVLYIPRPFNYKAIDAIIRVLTFDRGSEKSSEPMVTGALLVPIQITASASHSDSPAAFYPRYRLWLSDLEESVARNSKHVFVWLQRHARDPVHHESIMRQTRQAASASGEDIPILPSFTEVTVRFAELSSVLGSVTSSPPRTSSVVQPTSISAPVPFQLPGDGRMDVDDTPPQSAAPTRPTFGPAQASSSSTARRSKKRK